VKQPLKELKEPMTQPQKVQKVKEISARFSDADAALLTEYRGLSVTEIAEVRNALREVGTEYKVLKNTLTRLAVREVGLEELVGVLEGPTAIAFVHGDAVDAAKALDSAAKKYPVLIVKGGVLDGKVMDAEQAKGLARLESREVQLATIVMMINTPLQQTANVLSALLRDFGSMLSQVLQQKEEEAPPAEEPAAEEPAAEAPPESQEQAAAAPDAEPTTSVEEEAVAAAGPETPKAEEQTAPEGEAPEVPEAEEQAAAAPEAEGAAQAEATPEEVSEESQGSQEEEK
jgi:large subunit ribosomal protein L10